MFTRAIIGIDDVAGGASAGPVVAGLIVRARERKQRVKQTSLLQSKKNRVGPQFRAEPALA